MLITVYKSNGMMTICISMHTGTGILQQNLQKIYEILPQLKAKEDFSEANIGVACEILAYRKSWFGEGEVKNLILMMIKNYPTLNGTGTEDYHRHRMGAG
jgi:hypothetical protein